MLVNVCSTVPDHHDGLMSQGAGGSTLPAPPGMTPVHGANINIPGSGINQVCLQLILIEHLLRFILQLYCSGITWVSSTVVGTLYV